MDFTVYVDEKRFNELQQKGLDPSLGGYLHNIAVMIMAYDTGNARSAISNSKNTPRHIQIHYDLLKANYIKFLDEGVGPVKKHKGIVSVLTVGTFAEELIGWIVSGKNPTFTSPPVVALRQSKYRPFGAKSSVTGLSEKDVLRQSSMSTNVISAQARGEVSKVREYTYLRLAGGSTGSLGGVKTQTTRLQGHKHLASNKNLSLLKAVVQDQKKKLKEQRENTQDVISMNYLVNK